MLNSIRSHKFQETVSYYTEDIDYNENTGDYTAPGVGDRTGEEYDLHFEKCGTTFQLRDIRLHNT